MFDIGLIIKIQICMNENIQMKEEDAESENFRRFDLDFCAVLSLAVLINRLVYAMPQASRI